MAEDNAVNQKLALRLLQKHGHTVRLANNGREALDVLQHEKFDLVMMDVQMPVMDGLEATACIRAREQGSDRRIPIIALTAHAMRGDREKCLQAGMDNYISKPIQEKELCRVLSEIFQVDSAASGAYQPQINENAATGDTHTDRTAATVGANSQFAGLN